MKIIVARFWAVAKQAFLRRMSSVLEQSGRTILLAIILCVWWKLWQATDFGKFAGFRPKDALWYLMATEWIVLSIPYTHIDIEAEIRSGDFAFNLLRPGSYAGYQVANGIGLSTANWIAIGVVGISVTYALTGSLPDLTLARFASVGLLGLLAAWACTLVMVTLGLLAVWTNDATPFAWVWQKLQFVLGGLMFPLSIYPGWLKRLAEWTPFPHLLGNLATPMLGSGEGGGLLMAVLQVGLWVAGFSLILSFVFQRAVRRTLAG